MSQNQIELEAFDLLEKANKKATATSWFGGNKFDEAAELYKASGNKFKQVKQFKEAGDAFIKAADMAIRLKEPDEASSRYISAAGCYKQCSPKDAVEALKQGIALYVDQGRFQAAATHQKEMGEIYETDLVDLNGAIEAFEVAADWYSGENSNSMANNCWLKVAHLAATQEKYEKSIERFEKVALASIDNNLTKFSVKDYFLKAGLCHLLLDDLVSARRNIERYTETDMSFGSTRECKLLMDILEAKENGDQELFTQIVTDYDRLSKLDQWKTTILLRIKKSIEVEPSLT